jgi:POT family proton-dependent oligopeptide transporter
MPKPGYRTAPVPSEDLPKGIPYIIGNEAAERFSFYGMKAILFVFMTEYLVNKTGDRDVMSGPEATMWIHVFVMVTYLTPLFGALISDIFLGKYKTIVSLSLVYCLGHAALAIDETRTGLLIGLGLIALGAGGIKPCVSAHVGDQFGAKNARFLPRTFSWFYFSINFGATISSFLTPVLLHQYGPAVAFGVPGILMAIATLVFWMGRHKFVHIPPGGTSFVKEAFSGTGLNAMRHLFVLYLFVAVFWSLFDQTGSTWVQQANSMNRDISLFGLSFTLLSSQIQAANPFFILVLIPTFSYLLYPAISKFWPLTALRKIGIGLFLAAVPFLICAFVQMRIDAGQNPSILWQVFAYITLTAAEVFVSITALEFAYTQAPKKMKSWIMTFYLVSVAIGNGFTALVNFVIQNPDGTSKLEGPSYFLFFVAIIGIAAIIFVFVARNYKEQHYLQDEAEETTAS